jgi:hypothetical protein
MKTLARILLFLALAAPAHAQINGSYRGNVYYVKATGNDSNDGLSRGNPWQTISKVNSFAFAPGDIVLFRGGDSFTGSLKLHWIGGGIGAWDNGMPTINSAASACVIATDLYDFFIDHLVCTGSGSGVNTTAGISITNTGNSQLLNISVSNNTISGYGLTGILMAGGQGGWLQANISGNTVHDVAGANVASTACILIGSTATGSYLSTNTTIQGNTAYNCVGRTGITGNSGSGIVMSQMNGAIISGNVVHDFGTGSGTSSIAASGVGLFDSQNITISNNEIYNGATATNIPNSIFIGHNSNKIRVLGNYVHGNAGPGLLMANEAGFKIATVSNVYAAWNIFQSNVGVGEVALKVNTGAMANINVYNNTLYASATTAAFWCHGCGSITGQASNNIIQTAGATVNLTNDDNTNLGAGPFTFTKNDYTGTSTSFKQAATTYATYALWQTGTGQEKISGANVGLVVSPQLSSPGTGGTIGVAPPAFSTLTQYQFNVAGTKPMQDVGLNVATQYPSNSIPTLTQDFYGNKLPTGTGTGYPVGANAISTH